MNIFKLRNEIMDESVLEVYGWHTESSAINPDSQLPIPEAKCLTTPNAPSEAPVETWSAIDLAHNFYEVDYLPENDRIRYTISPDARKEVLKRLLLLNHKIYAEEVAQGLHDKKKSKNKPRKTQKKENDTQGSFDF